MNNRNPLYQTLSIGPLSLTTYKEIIDNCKFSSGGRATIMLTELESGFIHSAVPYRKTSNESIFRLTDEFSLFHLRFMEGVRLTGKETWAKISMTDAYKIWCGMSFEGVCLKHIYQLKKVLALVAFIPKKALGGMWVVKAKAVRKLI